MLIVMPQVQGVSKAIGPSHLVVCYSCKEIKLLASFSGGLFNTVKKQECSGAGLRYYSRIKTRKIVRVPALIDITIDTCNLLAIEEQKIQMDPSSLAI